jgi:hypothetical protein
MGKLLRGQDMNSKPRGRPLSPHRQLLKNPPPHIAKRIAARVSGKNEHWQVVMQSMDEFNSYLQAYRRSLFGVKSDVASGLLSIYDEAMTVSGMNQLLVELAAAKAKVDAGRPQQAKQRWCTQPEWKKHVAREMKQKKFAHIASALRVAQLILKEWPDSKLGLPSVTTTRKFIGRQRKLANLPLEKNSSG